MVNRFRKRFSYQMKSFVLIPPDDDSNAIRSCIFLSACSITRGGNPVWNNKLRLFSLLSQSKYKLLSLPRLLVLSISKGNLAVGHNRLKPSLLILPYPFAAAPFPSSFEYISIQILVLYRRKITLYVDAAWIGNQHLFCLTPIRET